MKWKLSNYLKWLSKKGFNDNPHSLQTLLISWSPKAQELCLLVQDCQNVSEVWNFQWVKWQMMNLQSKLEVSKNFFKKLKKKKEMMNITIAHKISCSFLLIWFYTIIDWLPVNFGKTASFFWPILTNLFKCCLQNK